MVLAIDRGFVGSLLVTIFGAIFIWNEFLVGLYLVNSQSLKTIPLGRIAQPADIASVAVKNKRNTEAIEVAHREHLRIELAQQLTLSFIQRTDSHERDASLLERR